MGGDLNWERNERWEILKSERAEPDRNATLVALRCRVLVLENWVKMSLRRDGNVGRMGGVKVLSIAKLVAAPRIACLSTFIQSFDPSQRF